MRQARTPKEETDGRATAPSVVERTIEQIALRIATGKYAAGERLPSVRNIAAEFGINPSTAQIVLASLQSNGFIAVVPGVGFVARDIEQFGGISTWRYLFRFAQQLPERATKIFEDFLAVRLLLMDDAMQKIVRNPKAYDPSAVRRTVQRMELLLATSPDDRTEIARTELHATRLMMLAVGQSVVTALLNSIGEIYLEQPAVIAAMYAEPRNHVLVWHTVLGQWEAGSFSAKGAATLRDELNRYDGITLERYRRLVTSAAAPAAKPATAGSTAATKATTTRKKSARQ